MQRHPFLSDEEQRLRNYSLGGQTSRSIVAKNQTLPCRNSPSPTSMQSELRMRRLQLMPLCIGMQRCRALDRSARSALSQLIHSFLSPDFVLDNCSCYVNHPAGGFAVTHPRSLYSFPFPFLVSSQRLIPRRHRWLQSSQWAVTTFNMIHRMTHAIGEWISDSCEIIVSFKDSSWNYCETALNSTAPIKFMSSRKWW